MIVGILDADKTWAKKPTNFPNLCSLKLSAYHKRLGDKVSLVGDLTCNLFDCYENYDKIYCSKVFTNTDVPQYVLNLNNAVFGGTGFYYDKAEKLPDEIEHIMPDYSLYDIDYSIGFLTRGCFRQCPFCVNKNFKKVEKVADYNEFYDTERTNKIIFLDDNFLGYKDRLSELKRLYENNVKFCFKQGLDLRILDKECAEILFKCRYHKDFIFAFDNVKDYDIIEKKLQMVRNITDKQITMYVLVGFDYDGKWDDAFWLKDFESIDRRCELLFRYNVRPYIMRYEKCYTSDYHRLYVEIARYFNQYNMSALMSFKEFCDYRPKKENDLLETLLPKILNLKHGD